MNPEEFRKAGHELIDWIADHRSQIEALPVRAQVQPGEVRNTFSASPPETVSSAESLLEQLQNNIVPGVTQVQHPMHFGWFPSNASLSSVLGDIASSGLGTLGISWESCPALTEVEEVVCDWMRQLVGLSDVWEGCIQDTASTACLTALLVARERASNFSENTGGLQAEAKPLLVYTTEEAHSSVIKAALLAGFGRDNVRLVSMHPEDRSMSAGALAAAIQQDIRNGCTPAAIVASVGSTGVTAFDPVAEMAEIAKQHSVWLHVDAAMAGSAMLLPECRHLWKGAESSDSISWNPHKWMGTILDCSLLYLRNPEELIRVMSTNPSYLRSTVDDEVNQFRDWGIPLGRRFRALKLWYQLELEGIESIQQRLRRDLENAQWFGGEVRNTDDWQVIAPIKLQTVCIRHAPSGMSEEDLEAHTVRWVNAINQSGLAFMSPAKLDGSWMVRVSIGVEATTRDHVVKLWQLIQAEVARSLSA